MTPISDKNSETLLRIQELSLNSAKDSFSLLKEGMTEKEACQIMHDCLTKQGVRDYFHYPFAWFGERTMFKDFSQPLPLLSKKTWNKLQLKLPKGDLPHLGKEFLPTDKRLEKNMAVILDVAPIINQQFADIGYSRFFGNSEEYNKMIHFLKDLRSKIPDVVTNLRNIKDIYHHIDQLIAEEGLINCHQLYPLGVLGHKVGNIKSNKLLNPLKKMNIMGFSPQAFTFLFSHNLTAPFYYNKETPYLASHINQEISEGYWAIEPHIGSGHEGAKFEEILIFQNNKATWLNPKDEGLNLNDGV